MKTLNFQELQVQPISADEVAAQYGQLETKLDDAQSAAECVELINEWDCLQRRLETWGALVYIRFSQNTQNADYKRQRDEYDEIAPKLKEFKLSFLKRLLDSKYCSEIEDKLGDYLLKRWEFELLTYNPIIEEDKVLESKLKSEYEGLLASAEVVFQDNTYNLASLGKFREDNNRETRHGSQVVCWKWFNDNAEQLDRIFDDLVAVRVDMANKLGFDNYTDLAYKILLRTDYGPLEVERYRNAIREHVVPLTREIRKQQAARLNLEKVMYWDEAVHDLERNPAPKGGHDDLVQAAQKMFDQMGNDFGEFFHLMRDSQLMDLEERKGKAVGGFCSDLAEYRLPFIYANFNGTKGDVQVFTHEMGHAYQCYKSRDAFPMDLWWPTAEAAEVHSMGLEFLTWPYMHLFFGEDAERFCRIHLSESLLFLPYGVAVDHFQHMIYANPTASPEERHGMWQEVEKMYLPDREYGDLDRAARGAFWQRQRHIYKYPFYYIDYTLAQACALQFWVMSHEDRESTMQTYINLCKRGGAAPFNQLIQEAGLQSPFEAGCLERVVEQAREYLSN